MIDYLNNRSYTIKTHRIVMEPFTFLSISGAAILITSATYLYKSQAKKVVIAARERAAERVRNRAFADTRPMHDFEINASDFEAFEIDDRYDGRGALTIEQKQIISRLMNDVNIPTINLTRTIGMDEIVAARLDIIASKGKDFSPKI